MLTVQNVAPHPTLSAVTCITAERIYLAPHPLLRGSISHYTVCMPHEGAAGPLTIVPDASGSLVCRLAKQGGQVATWFWGPSSRAVVVENNPHRYPLYIMVEFLPCGAHRLFRMPMDELHNAMIPLAVLDVPLHQTLVAALERLATPPHDLAAVCAALNAAFLRRLEQGEEPRLARHVISEVQRTNGTLPVAALALRLGCSPRRLARTMTERLGMPVKSLARIIRVNAACRRMNGLSVSLTELAHSLHYHDQSHFIHDFTDICGVTPGEYMQRLSHFYNEELKLGAILPSK